MLKRSYMPRKPYQWRKSTPLRRTPIIRGQVITSAHSTTDIPKDIRARRLLNPSGKKAKLRETINRRNRARFRAMGLYDVCEARLEGCWNTDLTWSHGRKDRKLTMHEREFLVIRCCAPCHRRMDEEMSPDEMLAFTESIIANRKVAA